jgi:3D (Asp-Asp-Asp) domain-containing protein
VPISKTRIIASLLAPRSAASALRLSLTVAFGAVFASAVFAARTQSHPPVACEALHVSLVVDGETRAITTPPSTVADLLSAQKVHLNEFDRCSAPLTALVGEGTLLTVTRVRSEVVLERTPLPFPVKQSYTSGLSVGNKTVNQHGKLGEHVVKYICTYKDGTLTEKVRHGDSTTAPQPQIEVVGTRGMTLASRGYFAGRRIIEMVATGYGPSGNGRWGARTASGLRPGFGVVAVDPRFIPLGTRLYISGYGYAVAGDTGGAIKGNRIDLGHDTNYEAMAEGRKKVRVLVLN